MRCTFLQTSFEHSFPSQCMRLCFLTSTPPSRQGPQRYPAHPFGKSSNQQRDACKKRKQRTTSKDKEDKKSNPLKYLSDLESDWSVKNNRPHFVMRKHVSIDVKGSLVLSTAISRASENDYRYFQHVVATGLHGKTNPPTVYDEKGYCGWSNREFLNLNKIDEAIMRKDQINGTLTEYEISRNKMIAKLLYIIEQYFGLTEESCGAGTPRFTTIIKEWEDRLIATMAFNIKGVISVQKATRLRQ